VRIVLFGAIAFVLGIAGGTGVAVVTAPKPVAVADSTAGPPGARPGPDSTHAVAASHTSAITPVPAEPAAAPADAPTTAANPHEAPGGAPGNPPSAHAAPASEASAGLAEPAPAVSGSHTRPRDVVLPPGPEEYKQVARILTNMKATDAARIMGYLPDELVEGIVRSLGPRQAATLLTQLPPARAAALSRKLLYRTSSRETP
jgi:hypothetical protein